MPLLETDRLFVEAGIPDDGGRNLCVIGLDDPSQGGASHLEVQLRVAGRADVSPLYCGLVGISSLGTAEEWPTEEGETVRSLTAGTGLPE